MRANVWFLCSQNSGMKKVTQLQSENKQSQWRKLHEKYCFIDPHLRGSKWRQTIIRCNVCTIFRALECIGSKCGVHWCRVHLVSCSNEQSVYSSLYSFLFFRDCHTKTWTPVDWMPRLFFWRRSCRCQIKRVTFSLYSGQQYKTSNLELRSFPLSKLTWWRVNGPNNGLFYFYLAFLVMPSTKIVCLWYTQSLRQTEIKCYFATEMFRYSVCILGTFTVYLPEIKQ